MGQTTNTFRIQVGGGKMLGTGRISFAEFFRCLRDGWYEITVRRLGKKRSLSQNAYYWGVIIPAYLEGVREEQGYIKCSEWAHEQLKHFLLFSETYNEKTGQIFKEVKDSKDLTTTEFEEYQEDCRRLILDNFSIIVPLPNEQLEL